MNFISTCRSKKTLVGLSALLLSGSLFASTHMAVSNTGALTPPAGMGYLQSIKSKRDQVVISEDKNTTIQKATSLHKSKLSA